MTRMERTALVCLMVWYDSRECPDKGFERCAGNPIGGLVFSSAFGELAQLHEWTVLLLMPIQWSLLDLYLRRTLFRPPNSASGDARTRRMPQHGVNISTM